MSASGGQSPGDQLADSSACGLVDRVQAGELSALEVLEACLERITAHNEAVNAIVTLDPSAEEQAASVDRRLAAGEELPLAGLPVGIKDVTPVGGLRLTYGSPLYRDHVAGEDALVVSRLRRAGAVIVGKTNTPEFATGGNTFNEVFGRTANPWNLEKSAGGSTGGGAAALATGMIALAEGTDLGGSLRIPASFCGITGLRPSPGLIPTWPSDDLWDNLQVTGTMARRAKDIALSLDALAGPSRRVPLAQPTRGRQFRATVEGGLEPGTRVAYCPDISGIGVDTDIEAVCRQAVFALQDRGAVVEETSFDLTEGWQAFLALRALWMLNQHAGRLEDLASLGDNVRGNIEAGLALDPKKLGHAAQTRSHIHARFREFFTRFDFLATPSMCVSPFPVTENYPQTVAGREMKTYVDWIAPTFTLSLTSLPVASVPCGLDPHRMPAGLQLVGPMDGEEKVLALAATLEELAPIGKPPLLVS